ncbi:septum site-determining protein MinC [Photobacterium lutimaris]|uniref:Probable septum site-determining protein MinC n=1 Tax=Photobacterium lutimaris TaxID=388278 RepID=A0A2T3IVK9_9GAMM|nr:septum site-determining protein MinC [Photobacterium lutimaris]PSU32466.1 septum site-determining protein MinC [Photobacterium lutimaris]TDR77673.1 septum site-determining protein MinC [Photobacterium lutimaris]
MTKSAELKGGSFTLSALHLVDGDIQQAINFLKEKVEQAPHFFSAAPIVIDVSQAGNKLDFALLKSHVQAAGMIPVGISGCKQPGQQEQAKQAGFAIMNAAKQAKAAEPVMTPTKIIKNPVRSGQQIYAKNSDLIVLGHVSPAAEIIADGCIHVYGTLRGRAIAGASGQKEAKIFCHNLQPELISIAGNYWLSDKIQEEFWGSNVVISLAENNLNIEQMAL